MSKCLCCKEEAVYSVLLAEGPNGDRGNGIRYYIPNQSVRESPEGTVKEIWFCHSCMRAVEDNMRATIAYLQAECGSPAKKKQKFVTKLASNKSIKS